MFPSNHESKKESTESLVKRPDGSTSIFQRPNVSPKFQIFEEKYTELENLDLGDPEQVSHIEELIIEVCRTICSNDTKLPDDFVNESRIVSFLLNLLSVFSDSPSIYEKTSILLFYVLKSSKQAIVDFLQNDQEAFIMNLFNSENLKERQICYEIIIRFNDPNCKDIGSQQFCNELNLYPQIVERINDILDNVPLNDNDNSMYCNNVVALLKVILGITNILPSDQIEQLKDDLFTIFQKILEYEDEKVCVLLSKYAIYSLFFLAKDPLYEDIIQSDLFEKSMNFIKYEEIASFPILLSIQMLQVSSEDKDCLEKVKGLLPIAAALEYFQTSEDPQLLRYILTLFTNSICFDANLTKELAKEQYLNRLNQLLQDINSDIQNRAAWCLWNMLRFGCFEEVITKILIFNDLSDNLVELSFEFDDVQFIKSVLVPSIMSISKTISLNNAMEEDPYSTFMESLIDPLKSLCYKESSPEIMCLAASCLKAVFPKVYEDEDFK